MEKRQIVVGTRGRPREGTHGVPRELEEVLLGLVEVKDEVGVEARDVGHDVRRGDTVVCSMRSSATEYVSSRRKRKRDAHEDESLTRSFLSATRSSQMAGATVAGKSSISEAP